MSGMTGRMSNRRPATFDPLPLKTRLPILMVSRRLCVATAAPFAAFRAAAFLAPTFLAPAFFAMAIASRFGALSAALSQQSKDYKP
jgi:hypothetical protein